jgi:NAD-dependent SIR2 family protein deacetylase
LDNAAQYPDEDDEIILEAYCVRCKQTIEVEHPQPVWTRRGMPATRGECPDCGGTRLRRAPQLQRAG